MDECSISPPSTNEAIPDLRQLENILHGDGAPDTVLTLMVDMDFDMYSLT